MRTLAFALATLLASSACVAYAAPPARPAERRDDRRDRAADRHSKWDKLGERWVDGRADRDVVVVARRERYHQLMIVVEHSAVELDDIQVVFGNGEVFAPRTRLIFGRGTTSRTIDLPGDKRHIARVIVRARNLPGGGRAQIEVWGLGGRRT